MNKKVSINIEENKIEKLEAFVQNGQFRNKSRVIEFALDKFMKEEENGLFISRKS